jgi:hypothetical protein
VFVIARRAKPGVAIQPFIDFIDYLDCFAEFTPASEPGLAMTILAGFLSFSAAFQARPHRFAATRKVQCAYPGLARSR